MTNEYSDHAQERAEERHIPMAVVKRAMNNPFMTGIAKDNRTWGVVNAVIDGSWKFVLVFWEVRGWTNYAITAFVPRRDQILNMIKGR